MSVHEECAYRDGGVRRGALADGWRFGGLHATRERRRVRTLRVAPEARRGSSRLRGPRRRSLHGRPRPRRPVGRARGARPPRDPLRRTRAAAPARRPRPRRSRAGPSLCAAATPTTSRSARSTPADRVRPLPLPRRRRPDPAPRRAPLLQAPRARARRRGTTLDEGLAYAARACAACAVTNARRLRARLRGGARPRADARARAACGRSCSSSSGSGTTSTTSPRSAPASASPPARWFAALTERARRLNARADRPPLPLRQRRVGGSDSRSTRDGARAARAELAALREDAAAPGASSQFNPSFQDRLRRDRRPRGRRRRTARRGRPGRPRRRARRRRPRHSPRLAYDGFEPAVPSAPPATSRRARAARARARADVRRSSTRCSTARRPRPPRRTAARERSASGRVESPRGATSCIVERSGDRSSGSACAPARTRTGRRSPTPPPATCCPTSPRQQELRALLRLRRPLMLTLLRDLRRLRREHRAPGPEARRQPRAPPRRRRLVQRLRARAHAHRRARTTTSSASASAIVASPRHADVLLVTGAVTTRMREPLLVAYDAMPEPRRVAALGDCALGCNLLGSRDQLVGPVDAAPARRPPHPRLPTHARRRSPRRCSPCSKRRATQLSSGGERARQADARLAASSLGSTRTTSQARPTLLEQRDHAGGDVELPALEAVAGGGREGVVAVVPGLAERQRREPGEVARLVAGLERRGGRRSGRAS